MNRELIERIDELMSLRTRLKCGEYDGNDIMQAWLAIDELLDCKAALSQQSAVTDDMRYAVRFAPSSAHWSERLLELFGPDARKGIDALEAQLREALSQQEAEPVAYTWDDNNGIGGSPNPRVAFEYPQYFTGPVKKLYSVPPKPAPLPQPEREPQESGLVQIHDWLLSLSSYPDSYPMAAMLGHLRKLQRDLSAIINAPLPQVASVPQDVEEFIAKYQTHLAGGHYEFAVDSDYIRAWMAGHARVPVETMRDAARYRWLRGPENDISLIIDKRTSFVAPDESVPGVGGYWQYEYRAGEDMDISVDAAMLTASKENQNEI